MIDMLLLPLVGGANFDPTDTSLEFKVECNLCRNEKQVPTIVVGSSKLPIQHRNWGSGSHESQVTCNGLIAAHSTSVE